MSLIALGINHTTANVALREKIAFAPGSLHLALRSLTQQNVAEAVILSTCNRTELYCAVEPSADGQRLLQWLAQYHQLDAEQLADAVYFHYNDAAVRHLMRVACGLDSLVLGEPQILGQLKQAFFEARDAGTLGSVFHRLFQDTFSAAKRIRSETEIGTNAVSVAYSAVSLARHIFTDLKQSQVLLIGAGETIELVARHLVEQGVQALYVANRTLQRAEGVAQQFDADILTLHDIPDYLPKADIVISSTGSPLPILGKGMVQSALKKRKHQPMLLIDIAVPRDIEHEVGELNDAYLYSVDDLQQMVQHNMASRQHAAKQAEQIVEQEMLQFIAWQTALQNVDTLRGYRQQSEQYRDELVEKALLQLDNGIDAQLVIKELGNKLTNKLIHAPTVALSQASKAGAQDRVAIIAQSLGLLAPSVSDE